jgi:hypothetical protein
MPAGAGSSINSPTRHAGQRAAEGIECYVARTGRFTLNARGGQLRLVDLGEHSPMKREDPPAVIPARQRASCRNLMREPSAH